MKRLILTAISFAALTVVPGCKFQTPASVTPTTEKLGASSQGLGDVATAPMDGYILISPLRAAETYLLNADKQVVHRWTSNYPPGNLAYLMDNGDLLRAARDPDVDHFHGGGIGTMVERFSWDGELLWRYRYANEEHCVHHDIQPLPNGNVLMIAWERKTKEEAIAQGRDPNLLNDDLWPDHVIEVQPDGPTGGKIVWQWHMWDHLVQDFDREKPNYGVVYEHPELIDLNNTGSSPPATPEELRKLRAVGYTGGGDDGDDNRRIGSDWMHTNAIHYNPKLDQISLSAKNFSEVWIIDHSTTTEEAASHSGGRSGRGGDLLYRWGNPWSYKSGTTEDKILFDQHDVRWVSAGFPGAGHITAFNNGRSREYSSITEIAPPVDADGEYILDDEGRFGPNELAWEYTAEPKEDFYSSFISGAERLQNGNTFICEGATGRYFEVNSEGKIVWEHVNTLGGELTRDGRPNDIEDVARKIVTGEKEGGFNVENNALFRATKYPTTHPGLAGRTLAPLADQPIPFSTLVEAAVERLRAEQAEQITEPATEVDKETAAVTSETDKTGAVAEPTASQASD